MIKFITSVMRAHAAPISGGDNRPTTVRKKPGKQRSVSWHKADIRERLTWAAGKNR